jgi:predicted CxxxxCH...CXXCH cytochrome family protein
MNKMKNPYGKNMNHTAETDMPMNPRTVKTPLWKYMTMPLMILTCLVIALVMSAVVARTAFADQVTLIPDGVVSTGGWAGVTAGNLSDGAGGGGGGDGTFATITGALDTFSVTMSNNAAYTGATINSLTLWVRIYTPNGTGNGGNREYVDFGPAGALSGANTTVDRTGFSNFSYAPAGPFNDTDIDNLAVEFATTNLAGGEEVQVAEVWAVVDYTPPVGMNELNTCDGCHNQPPDEEASRNGATGAIIGSHAAHGAYACTVCHPNNAVLNHRGGQGVNSTEGQIDMLANIQGGTYSLGSAGFIQDNEDGTGLGTCSDISCHGGATTTTPQWGSGALNCDGCHGAPPATNAHDKHYASKGWGATDVSGTYCSQCHPDNTALHSDVTDGIVEVSLSRTGAGGSTSCSSWANGCHNDSTNTPNWSTTGITCLDCHSTSGTNTATVANPTSGLHDEVPTISGVRHHPFDPNFTDCVDCHTTTPSVSHWDGTSQLSAPTINFDLAATGFVDGTPPTCTSSCHNDNPTSGPWQRLWHEDSNVTTGAECNGCHGSWGAWNGGVTHRSDAQPETIHGTGTYKCRDCHSLGESTGNTGYVFTNGTNDWFPNDASSNHGDAKITINNEATHGFARGTGGQTGLSGCSNACHADGLDGTAPGSHSFVTTNWTLDARTDGVQITSGCDTCHGGGGQYWPNGTAYPNDEERHDEHMTQIASRLGITLPGSDLEQKRMCQYCHTDPGGSGHSTDSGDSVADVDNFNPIWDATNPPSAGDTGAAFVIADGGCNSIACHNNTNTGAGTYGWRDAGTSDCTMCHTAGVAKASPSINPTSGLHDVTPTVSGVTHDQTLDASGCAVCHTATPSAGHINGSDADTPTVAGSSGYSSGNPATCTNVCHSDNGNWARYWHENAGQSNGTECDGCHGTFATNNGDAQGFGLGVAGRHQISTEGDPGGQIEANHDGTDKCLTCHAYDGADGFGHKWATHHLNDTIEISDQVAFVDNGGTVGCAAGCHNSNDGTGDGGHEFDDVSSRWGRAFVAGPTAGCTSCHSAHGTGSAGVGPNSPHSNDTAAGGGVYTCEGCHTSHSGGTITIANKTWLGIHYDSAGHTGIQLGGTDTTGSTEAEICWNCHTTHGVKEWNKTWGSYQTGDLDQYNWVGANWTSAIADFNYKDGPIASVHATGNITAKDSYTNSDAVGSISCTYCHDVHDTGSLPGDPNNGASPFLRGTWTSNPFKNDGAPRSGMTMASDRGAVPRGIGSKAANTLGGWQIEQNNASFTNTTYGGAGGFAGVCDNCHGKAQLQTDWSGHQGAVSGFDGNTGNNFLSPAARGNPDGLFTKGHMSYNQYADPTNGGRDGGDWVGGLRNARQWKDGITPQDIDSLKTTGTNITYPAGAVTSIMSGANDIPQNDFHNFPCSKCHNPHASRLPRLMITNCLDVSKNTWDDSQGDPSTWTPGNHTGQTSLAYSTTAQNCHRYTGGGTGWNTVTPW